jgi:N-acyl-D-aspartate/D-glutamate deacylase
MRKLAVEMGVPVSYALLEGLGAVAGDKWRLLLEMTAEANRAAGRTLIKPQVAARPTGLLLGWEGTANPFLMRPSFQAIAEKTPAEKLKALRDPAFKARLMSEEGVYEDEMGKAILEMWDRMFQLGDPPDYEPPREKSAAALAAAQGRHPQELVFDWMMERDGRGLVYLPLLNYAEFDFEAMRAMLLHPDTVNGLSDGGAHCGVICDVSMPTFLLTHWCRDRTRGPQLGLEHMVKRQTRDTAMLYGFEDRGVLKPGMLADLNVIDHGALRLHEPEMVYDLPAGGRRLIQRADGYVATVKRGQIIAQDGEMTGALPGRLVRGPQTMPKAQAAAE